MVSQLNSLQICMDELCGNNGNGSSQNNGGNSGSSGTDISNVENVTLSSAGSPSLDQNNPNPFNSNTKINYYLPDSTQGATLVFYDANGNQLKTVPLTQTGNGALNVTSDNLAAGIYSYSLIVNNKVIDTKRMVLQK